MMDKLLRTIHLNHSVEWNHLVTYLGKFRTLNTKADLLGHIATEWLDVNHKGISCAHCNV